MEQLTPESAAESNAIAAMIDQVQAHDAAAKRGRVAPTPARRAASHGPAPRPSSVAHTPAAIGGKVVPLSDAIAGLDELMTRAAKLAGTDLEGFKKLRKSEQNDFLSQARGEKKTGQPSDRDRLDLKPHQLVRSPWNREEFDPEKLEKLRESIREHGILQPLLVRPWQPQTLVDKERAFQAYERGELMFEIVAGERRWTAASLENLASVPVIVRTLTDEEAIELQAIENLQREDLNAIDEAAKYQQLSDIYTGRGMKKEDAVARICQRLGRSRASVFDCLKLLKLPEKLQTLTRSGELPKSHAGIISQIKDPERAALVAKTVLFSDTNGTKRKEPLPFKETKQLVDDEITRQRNVVVYEEKRAEFEKAGRRILTPEESAEAVRYWKHNNAYAAVYSSPYVLADNSCDLPGADYREFSKLWGKKRPEPILAQASNGFPVEVFLREEAEAAVKAAGKIKPEDEAEASAEDAEHAEAERKAKEQRDVFAAALPMILEKEKAGDPPAAVWRWLVIAYLRTAWTAVSKELASRHKLDKKGDTIATLEAYVGSLTGHEARALMVEAVLLRNRPDYRGHTPDFLRAAEIYNLDLAAIAAEVQTSGQTKKGKGKK